MIYPSRHNEACSCGLAHQQQIHPQPHPPQNQQQRSQPPTCSSLALPQPHFCLINLINFFASYCISLTCAYIPHRIRSAPAPTSTHLTHAPATSATRPAGCCHRAQKDELRCELLSFCATPHQSQFTSDLRTPIQSATYPVLVPFLNTAIPPVHLDKAYPSNTCIR